VVAVPMGLPSPEQMTPSGSEPMIESLHISWTDVSSTCKAAVALLVDLLTSDMFSGTPPRLGGTLSAGTSLRPMVIARSVKLLSLFSLIFSSGLCFGYSSWWYVLS
jgi:hypothetical protein